MTQILGGCVFYIKIEQHFVTRNITVKFSAHTCSTGVINKENYRYLHNCYIWLVENK